MRENNFPSKDFFSVKLEHFYFGTILKCLLLNLNFDFLKNKCVNYLLCHINKILLSTHLSGNNSVVLFNLKAKPFYLKKTTHKIL